MQDTSFLFVIMYVSNMLWKNMLFMNKILIISLQHLSCIDLIQFVILWSEIIGLLSQIIVNKKKLFVDFCFTKKDLYWACHISNCVLQIAFILTLFWHCTALLPHTSTKGLLLILLPTYLPTYEDMIYPPWGWRAKRGEEKKTLRGETNTDWVPDLLIYRGLHKCRWWLRLTLLHPQ